MTQPLYKDASMKARALFKSANSFIIAHLGFTLFYAAVTLTIEILNCVSFVSVMQAAQLFLEKNQLSNNSLEKIVTSKTILSNFISAESIKNFAASKYVPLIILGAYFLMIFFKVALVFFMQALLRNRKTSIIHEIYAGMHALLKAPWMMLFLVIQMSFAATYIIPINFIVIYNFNVSPVLFGIIVLTWLLFVVMYLFFWIPLFYAEPLLYDGYFSFLSALKISWSYVKQSWFIGLKYILLNILVLSVLVLSISFIAFFIPLISNIGNFFLNLYFGLLGSVGYNMIYNHIRISER